MKMEEKNKHEVNSEQIPSDRELSKFFKSRIPDAPESPWFTRTVLNRLPDKKKKKAAAIEIYICAIALVAVVIFGVSFVIRSLEAPVITIGDMIVYAVYLILFAGILYNILTPWIYRRVNV